MRPAFLNLNFQVFPMRLWVAICCPEVPWINIKKLELNIINITFASFEVMQEEDSTIYCWIQLESFKGTPIFRIILYNGTRWCLQSAENKCVWLGRVMSSHIENIMGSRRVAQDWIYSKIVEITAKITIPKDSRQICTAPIFDFGNCSL